MQLKDINRDAAIYWLSLQIITTLLIIIGEDPLWRMLPAETNYITIILLCAGYAAIVCVVAFMFLIIATSPIVTSCITTPVVLAIMLFVDMLFVITCYIGSDFISVFLSTLALNVTAVLAISYLLNKISKNGSPTIK